MNNISNVADKCTGCTACMSSCTKKAIHMVKDKTGFYYPLINNGLCTNCGMCKAVCPAIREKIKGLDTRKRAYYGSVLDVETIKASSSGGAFSFMADYVLKNGGLVCGAVINYNSMEIIYSSTDDCGLDAIRRSKYVASMPQKIFKTIKAELNKNRLVLFCGLPCHVDGLKNFLMKEYDDLITLDFICGGVASPDFFKEHISYLEKKYKSKVIDINFRAKLNGWKEHSIKIKFINGKEYSKLARDDSFFQGYFEKAYQRDSCYQCQYRLSHVSDVIIADYWGGLKKGRGNDAGVSMIISNSSKGEKFVSRVLQNSENGFIEMPITDSDYVFKSESERYRTAYKNKKIFIDTYERYGFEKTTKKTYLKGSWKKKLKIKVIKLLRKNKESL